ncbi:MAG: serine hydrolase [Clostridia bacterium]|nr:serine hydrolase [Clostridia bacterium]
MSISDLNNAITLLGRLMDTRQAIKPIYPATSEKPAFRASTLRQPFPRCAPEEVGISSSKIAAFLSDIAADETLNMHSILILKDGSMITEAVFADQSTKIWKYTFSACKSITSLAIGFLFDEGLLRTDEKLSDIFGDAVPPLTRIAIRDMTVENLLTMTTGASFNEVMAMTEPDWIKGYFSGTFSPGTFAYNSLNSYMLSAIVEKKTGQHLSDYLKPRLFDPLGIDNYYWEKCPKGIDKGGWGLYMLPEDMAKIGQLVLQNGIWQDRVLLSAEWIDRASHTRVRTGAVSDLFDYGYQIWTGDDTDAFLFNGMLGQNVLAFRKSGILLVSNGGNAEMFQTGNYFTLAHKYFAEADRRFIPMTNANPLPAVLHAIREHPATGQEHVKPKRRFGLFARKRIAAPSAAALPAECDQLSGVTFTSQDENAPSLCLMPVIWQAIQNCYGTGLSSLSFLKSDTAFYMTYAEAEESYLLRIGFGYPADTDLSVGGKMYHVRTLGKFTRDEDGIPLLSLRITFAETPLTRYIKIYYTGESPHIQQYERPGGDFILMMTMAMKNELTMAPIIGGTLNKVDNDYIKYRINKRFSPDVSLHASKTIPRRKKLYEEQHYEL